MTEHLENRLKQRWPGWFDTCDGFSHDDGWFQIVWNLCEEIEKILYGTISEEERKVLQVTQRLDGKSDFIVEQVKEKYGILRFYAGFSGTDEILWSKIHDAIAIAETRSGKTCESCGQPGELNTHGWWKTLCKDCADLRAKK